MKGESDEDFCSPKPPVPPAPRRPEKKGSVQSLPVLSIPCSSLSTTDVKNELFCESKPSISSDTCGICSKNLSHLNELRKIAHVNKCLDTQESRTNHVRATEKWNNTIDCPMCGEPQPPGPHRAAHAKRCGKKFNISPKELLRLIETQTRVSNAKKRASMIHTKAPVPVKKEVLPPKLHGAPKSLLDEETQLAQALSASMAEDPLGNEKDLSQQFTRIDDPNEKRRKRPRSYAIVELAPRSCKCEVLQKVHDRFLETFKVRKINGEIASHAETCRQKSERTNALLQYQKRLLQKLERLERLSEDLCAMVDSDIVSDLHIHCQDGTLNGHRAILQARTTLVTKTAQCNASDVDINENRRVVSLWLRYVYSGRVEWQNEDTDKIQKLAEEHGPDDLAPLCVRLKGPKHTYVAGSAPATTTSSEPAQSCSLDTVENVKAEDSAKEEVSPTVSSTPSHVSEVVVPEILKVELEPGAPTDSANNSFDSEDPLQGIQIANNSGETAGVECIVIEDDSHTEVEGDNKQVNFGTKTIPEDVASTSIPYPVEGMPSMHDSVDADKITMIDMPEELDASRPSSSRKSPDLFDEKSRTAEDVVGEDFSWDFTRLRTPADAGRPSSSKTPFSNEEHSRSSPVATTQTPEPIAVLDYDTVQEKDKALGESMCSESSDIICLDDNSRPSSSLRNQPGSVHSADPYQDEYYNYHDPFMEAWYEPAEMGQLSVSQPVDVEQEAMMRYSKSPAYEMRDESKSTSEKKGLEIKQSQRSLSEQNLGATADAASKSTSNAPLQSATQDSFFDTPRSQTPSNNVEESGNRNSFTVDCNSPNFTHPVAQSTPAEPVKKKPRFGSHVKVLKTSGITPMPDYEKMTDDELKRELSKFSLKPMGRKRAIAMLRRIYDEIHPLIDPSTPTVRPLVKEKTVGGAPLSGRQAKMKKARAKSRTLTVVHEADPAPSPEKGAQSPTATESAHEEGEDEDFVDLGDKTLNDSRDEPPEESMIGDTGILPKDMEGMTQTFLAWLRRPENDQLYNHLLSLQPVLIDELHLRMSRADSAVCGIPKKVLANVLDRLGITFSLPQVHGGRRANKPRRAGKR